MTEVNAPPPPRPIEGAAPEQRLDATASAPGPGSGLSASAGGLLRAERERQGLHIAALAAAIKVTPKTLEALEADRIEELPDVAFARALAMTVCRSLKTDSQPVLKLLPPLGTVLLEPSSRIQSTPFREHESRGDIGGAAVFGGLGGLGIWALAALVLVLGAVALFFAPSDWWRSSPATVVRTTVPLAPVLETPASAPDAAATGLPAASEGAASAASDARSALPPSTDAAASAVAASAAALEAVAAAALTGGNPAAGPAGTAVLLVRATQTSWVEVRDARGTVLLSDTLVPGASVKVEGALPLKVQTGNAVGTEISFRGQRIDVPGRARDNVARFELP